jgi:hypothetical protein
LGELCVRCGHKNFKMRREPQHRLANYGFEYHCTYKNIWLGFENRSSIIKTELDRSLHAGDLGGSESDFTKKKLVATNGGSRTRILTNETRAVSFVRSTLFIR